MNRVNDTGLVIDFRRRFRHDQNGEMHIFQSDRSRYGFTESLILISFGLMAGFGLGLAYAMLMITKIT
jgi:hypothetical protein